MLSVEDYKRENYHASYDERIAGFIARFSEPVSNRVVSVTIYKNGERVRQFVLKEEDYFRVEIPE